VRENWQNLNGTWQYAITADSVQLDQVSWTENWAGQILVPFPLESRLGGVQRLLHPDEALWYRREFEVDRSQDRRTLLHFEAVDYRCEVFVNGKSVGRHQGGHTPFSFDITEFLQEDAEQPNELVVRVEDDTEEWQLRGKQVRDPHGIWYTQVSGIWQSVWLEEVPPLHIADLKITTDAEERSIGIKPELANDRQGRLLRVRVFDGDAVVHDTEPTNGDGFELVLSDPKLWSPDTPHLYDLEVSLLTPGGELVDQV